MSAHEPPDYVVVGHLTLDRISSCLDSTSMRPVLRLGGTAFYSAVTALRLGRRVGIVTSFGDDLAPPPELEGVAIARVRAESTTMFEIARRGQTRTLHLASRAAPLSSSDVPAEWRGASLAHLAPLCGELHPGTARAFVARRMCATAQGWLRRCAVGEPIEPLAFAETPLDLAGIDVIVISRDDLGTDESSAEQILDCWRTHVPIVLVTDGARGCAVYDRGRVDRVASFPASEVDSIGAGDVFAAGFFIRLDETDDPIESATFAAAAAALFVEGSGLESLPTRDEVLRAMATRPRAA